MAPRDIGVMAHLMRRAGFGSTHEELELRAKNGYEDTVEELLDPEAHGIPHIDEGIMFRHNPGWEQPGASPQPGKAHWMYRMINTPRPLEEKMTLFWHMVFATANAKIDGCNELLNQLAMFRKYGMGNYQELLVALAKDPAMIYFLDNNVNHKDAPNENWGRELLELFSMGQGNYTEKDVFECSRAFTGWTISPKIPRMPYAVYSWDFEYKPEDHDGTDKEFLGHTGPFNGEDIIDIIVKQPATAQFIARHLYNYFVADEIQVPSWKDVAPKDPEAVQAIADTFVESGYDIRSTLRMIFNSDFFKDESVWFAKVKSPAEVVAGTMRLIKDYQSPRPGMIDIGLEPGYQGQDILDPPSVEGWHTGHEWIDSGSLLRRVNFVADRVGDIRFPGVQLIIDRIKDSGELSTEQLIDGCLDLMGYIKINTDTRKELIGHIESDKPSLGENADDDKSVFERRVCEILQLIASTREYQFG